MCCKAKCVPAEEVVPVICKMKQDPRVFSLIVQIGHVSVSFPSRESEVLITPSGLVVTIKYGATAVFFFTDSVLSFTMKSEQRNFVINIDPGRCSCHKG